MHADSYSTDKSYYDVTDIKLSISPNPPDKGKSFKIILSGTVSKSSVKRAPSSPTNLRILIFVDKEIQGGKIKVKVKYEIFTVLDEEYDLCDLLKEIGKECPIPPGKMNVSCVSLVIDACTSRMVAYFHKKFICILKMRNEYSVRIFRKYTS